MVVDSTGMIKKNEVGLTEVDGEASVLSYGLEKEMVSNSIFHWKRTGFIEKCF